MSQLDLLQNDLFTDAKGTSPRTAKNTPPKFAKPAPKLSSPEPEEVHAHDTHEKSPDAFKTISETADLLGIPQHVLRFWESRFKQIKPLKMAGGRRYYRPQDVDTLQTIKHLLYKEGYTIKGARKAFEQAKREKRYLSEGKIKQVLPVPKTMVAPPSLKAARTRVAPEKKQDLMAIRDELLSLKEALLSLRPI